MHGARVHMPGHTVNHNAYACRTCACSCAPYTVTRVMYACMPHVLHAPVNQHHSSEDLVNLKEAIRKSSGGTLVVLGDQGMPLSRVWYVGTYTQASCAGVTNFSDP